MQACMGPHMQGRLNPWMCSWAASPLRWRRRRWAPEAPRVVPGHIMMVVREQQDAADGCPSMCP